MRRLDMNKITAHEFFAINAIECELIERTVQALEAYDKLQVLNFITRKIIGDVPLIMISVTDIKEIHNIAGLITRPIGLVNIIFTETNFEFKKKSISSREWMIDFREPKKEEPKQEIKENEEDLISIGTIKMGDIQLNDIKIKNPNDVIMNAIKACVHQIVDIQTKPKEEPVKPVEKKEKVVKLDKAVVSRCEEITYKVFDSCATEKVKITNENLTENVYETLCNLKQILNPKKFIISELYISNTGSLIIKTSNNQYYTGVTRGDKIELVPVHEDMFKIITANTKHMALYVEFTQF